LHKCGSVVQCVEVYCNILQRIVMCCIMLQCGAVPVGYNVLQCVAICCSVCIVTALPQLLRREHACCSVVQHIAVWCAVVCCIALQCSAVQCSVLQYSAVCYSAVQCVAACVQCVAASVHFSQHHNDSSSTGTGT